MLGVLRLIHKIILDCPVSQKVQFKSKLARDNSIAKEAQRLSKIDLHFFGDNDCYFKLDPITNVYKYHITFTPIFVVCSRVVLWNNITCKK